MKSCDCIPANTTELDEFFTVSGSQFIKTASNVGAHIEQSSGSGLDFHITKSGDVLASTSVSKDNMITTSVRGTIDGLPCGVDMNFQFTKSRIDVKVDFVKPTKLGSCSFHFDLEGVQLEGDHIMGATNVVASDEIEVSDELRVLGIGFWCALRCGGKSILLVLIRCLFALGGGIPGYVACVTAHAGHAAAGIAICIARNCIK